MFSDHTDVGNKPEAALLFPRAGGEYLDACCRLEGLPRVTGDDITMGRNATLGRVKRRRGPSAGLPAGPSRRVLRLQVSPQRRLVGGCSRDGPSG